MFMSFWLTYPLRLFLLEQRCLRVEMLFGAKKLHALVTTLWTKLGHSVDSFLLVRLCEDDLLGRQFCRSQQELGLFAHSRCCRPEPLLGQKAETNVCVKAIGHKARETTGPVGPSQAKAWLRPLTVKQEHGQTSICKRSEKTATKAC